MDAEHRRKISEGLKAYYRNGKESVKDKVAVGLQRFGPSEHARGKIISGAQGAVKGAAVSTGLYGPSATIGAVVGGTAGGMVNKKLASVKSIAKRIPKENLAALKESIRTGKPVGKGLRGIAGGAKAGAKMGLRIAGRVYLPLIAGAGAGIGIRDSIKNPSHYSGDSISKRISDRAARVTARDSLKLSANKAVGSKQVASLNSKTKKRIA